MAPVTWEKDLISLSAAVWSVLTMLLIGSATALTRPLVACLMFWGIRLNMPSSAAPKFLSPA